MRVALESCSFAYGPRTIFSDFDLGFEEGRITALLGPSGCGKTSLLRLVAGLEGPDSGRVAREGVEGIGMVFQEDRLLPWMSVKDNLEFALKPRIPQGRLQAAIAGALAAVGLEEWAGALPRHLSGGMRQRASIARAFAAPASLLLMDEAFRSLDIGMRMELSALFLALWGRERPTALVVTHDLDEALALAHRAIVIAGRPARIVLDREIIGEPAARALDSPPLLALEAELRRALLAAHAGALPRIDERP